MNFTQRFINSLTTMKDERMNINTTLALAVLSIRPNGMIMSRLGNTIGASSASITDIVDDLENLKLIRRERSVNDRRKIALIITEEGQDFLKRILP